MPTWALAEALEFVAAATRAPGPGRRSRPAPVHRRRRCLCRPGDRLGAASLAYNRRQQGPVQRAVADALADARPQEALDLLSAHGGLRTFAAPEDARAQLIEDWARAGSPVPGRPHPGPRPGRRACDERHGPRCARSSRAARRRALGGARPRVGLRRSPGLPRNDYRVGLDVRNGTRGTVAAVRPEAGALTLRADDGRTIVLPSDYLEHAHHGYALTGHVSQGATVERTYLRPPPSAAGPRGLRGRSRHRIDLRVYLSARRARAAAEALAERWGRRQAKHLATERLEVAGVVAAEHAPAPPREPEAPVAAAERAPAGGAEGSQAALRAERAALLASCAPAGPPDASDALRRLGAEHALVSADLRRVRDERAWAEAERAGIGASACWGGPVSPRRHAWRASCGTPRRASESFSKSFGRLPGSGRTPRPRPRRARPSASACPGSAGAWRPWRRPWPARSARPARSTAPAPSGPSPALVAERRVLAEHRSAAARPTRRPSFVAWARSSPGSSMTWPPPAPGRAAWPLGSTPLAPRLLRSDGRARPDSLQPNGSAPQERPRICARAGAHCLAPGRRRGRARGARGLARAEAPVLGRRIAALDREIARQVDARAQSAERERPAYLAQPSGRRRRMSARWSAGARPSGNWRATVLATTSRIPSAPRARAHRARPRPGAPSGWPPWSGPDGRSSGPIPRTARPSASRAAWAPRRGPSPGSPVRAGRGPAPRAAPGPEPRDGALSAGLQPDQALQKPSAATVWSDRDA